MQTTEGGLNRWRFIPRTFRHTILRDHNPFNGWAPCVYQTPTTLAPGMLAPVRTSLARDIAMQVQLALDAAPMLTQVTGEASHSIAVDDQVGDLWCACEACALSDGFTTPPEYSLYNGRVVGASPGVFSTTALPPDTTVTVDDAIAAQFPDRSLDALCARNLIRDNARPNQRSRRVVDLANAVANVLYDSAIGSGTPPATTVVSFQAYLAYLAPPATGPDPLAASEPTRLNPILMPFIVGSRDAPEYDHPFPSDPSPLRRMQQAPDQFNHAQWSTIASRLGLYEWLHGGGGFYLVPRIYTSRLAAALRFGYDHGARAFVSETAPHWGLDGPKLYVLANQLWDRTLDEVDLTYEFCQAVTEDDPAAAPSPVAESLASYFRILEAVWRRDFPSPDFPSNPLSIYPRTSPNHHTSADTLNHLQSSFEGLWSLHKSGTVTQFDYFAGLDLLIGTNFFHGDVPPPEGAAARLSPQALRRVKLYRTSSGLVSLLQTLYAPLRWAYNTHARMHSQDPDTQPVLPDAPLSLDERNTLRALTMRSDLADYFDPMRFQANIRQPVHDYLANELGLFPDASPRTTPPDQWRFGEPMQRDFDDSRMAFFINDLTRYAFWWDTRPGDAASHTRNATSDGQFAGMNFYFEGLKTMATFILLLAFGSFHDDQHPPAEATVLAPA